LSCYTPDDIDTDAKRKEKFLEGLNDELPIPLSVAYTPTFQEGFRAAHISARVMSLKKKEFRDLKQRHYSVNTLMSSPICHAIRQMIWILMQRGRRSF
jgi:hypothetical protein